MTTKVYAMSRQLVKARLVEDELMSRLATFGKVTDLRDDPQSRRQDIDFGLALAGRQVAVEVKVDSYHNTGNMAFETVSNAGKQTPGCMLVTQARVILYLFVSTGELLLLPIAATRRALLPRLAQFPPGLTSTGKGAPTYGTQFRKIPTAALLELVPEARWCMAESTADNALSGYTDYLAEMGMLRDRGRGEWPPARVPGARQITTHPNRRIDTAADLLAWIRAQPEPEQLDRLRLAQVVAAELGQPAEEVA